MKRISISGIFTICLVGSMLLTSACSRQKSNSSATVEKMKVGVLLPLTGPAAQLGQDEKAGLSLAESTFQASSRKVQFVIEDSQLKPATAVTIAKRMLDLDGIRIFWASTSGIVLSMAPAVGEKEEETLLFAQHTVPNATDGFPFMYRFYPSADAEIDVLADHAISKGYKRIGAFCLGNQSGELAMQLFQQRVTTAGIEVPITETFAYTQSDYRQTLEKFKHENVDAILIMGYTSHYKPIFRQMLEIDLNIPVLGGVATPLGGIEKDIPLDFLQHVTFPGCRFYFAPDSPVVVEFRKTAKAANVIPNYEVAYAFDLATTIQKAVDVAPSSDAAGIATAISQITPFEGVTGQIQFNAKRDILLDLRPCTWTANGISQTSK